MKKIVLIGGGFSGTITAVNLARLSDAPLEITIIDKSRDASRGIAYSTRNSSHLLNVVARNMSALADQPNHFVEWLHTRSEYLETPLPVLREMFIPRKTYGEYLSSLFLWYSGILCEEKEMRFETVNDEAVDIGITGNTAEVELADGRKLKADKIVLAVGNQTPVMFRLKGLAAKSRRYIGDPWLGWEAKLPPKDQDILLIGTGLTMVDTFLTLKDLGWKGKIIAVSRNGLLPLSHFKGFEYPDLVNDETAIRPFHELFRLFRKHLDAAKEKNVNPAILVDKLRPFTQRIWQNFSTAEKRQFNRHLRTRWNVVRHRIAPEIHQQMQAALADGRFEVIRGRLRDCVETPDNLQISVETGGVKRTLDVGAVINCTGPKENYLPDESPLFMNLLSRGLIQADDMNMGIKVSPQFSVISADGEASEIVFAMGAIMKGTLWETVAVPELRSQAFRLAETISSQITDNVPGKSAISEVVEDVVEYSI